MNEDVCSFCLELAFSVMWFGCRTYNMLLLLHT